MPGLKERFLAEDVDETVLGKLRAVAEKGIILLEMGLSNLVY